MTVSALPNPDDVPQGRGLLGTIREALRGSRIDYTTDPDVQPYAIACLRMVSLGFLFYAYGMVVTQAFNGAGDTWTPTVVNLFVFWLWEIPLAWWLSSRAGFGARGVFMALTMADSTLAVVSAILFRRGAWKKTAV